MSDAIDRALAVGEVQWALRCAKAAIQAAARAGGPPHLEALRRHADVMTTHADDTDLPDLARGAAAWVAVTQHALATAEDSEALAWAWLLAFKPRKAKAALEAAQALDATAERAPLVCAVAWAQRRTDPKRLGALVAVAATCDNVDLEWIARLLVQADVPALPLTGRLHTDRAAHLDVWDPRLARAVGLRVASYRSVGEPARAASLLADWARACAEALPDPSDARRHVLDLAEGTPQDALARAQRRVERAARHLGASSPALEQPLALLAFQARHAGEHAVAVDALLQLETLRSKGSSAQAHASRCDLLVDLYQSLTHLGRFDESFAAIERYERSKPHLPLHLVPDHHARAQVYEAQGDLDRMVEEHLAAVAQYEAAPPPVYGPTANNTRLCRGWARQALERAGRHAEAKALS
jgi:tetratricopeptide (TPR) repeat protein